MDCPYCHHPLAETAATCPSCGFHGAALERWLGSAPRLAAGLNDLTGLLDARQAARIEAARQHFVHLFPQCDFHFVLGAFDPQVPLPVMAFAFFNHSRVSAPNRTGGANRDLLLVTDVAAGRSHLAVGYGLEPLVARENLASVMEAAGPALQAHDAAAAAESVLKAWSVLLAGLRQSMPRQFGLPAEGEVGVPVDASLARVRVRRRNPY